ncbi:DUF6185 family protein [Alloactinosynnema sp. L-07]|uniref:DUF6185 family protein n=1 Tax=Alloactinosynnema sp. L-07 TaxID=1653480 RepID=UPI0006B4950A|nr:DUF6185 family protein [Alloactinosynnema sp. L-07]
MDIDAWLESDALDFPRLTVQTRIRVPRDVAATSGLTFTPEHPEFHRTAACLLGEFRGPLEIRDEDPNVVADSEWVTIAERSHTDIVDAGSDRPWVLPAGGAVLYGASDSPWILQVVVPPGIHDAVWTVSVHGPDKWLSMPRPWDSAVATTSGVKWTGVRALNDKVAASVRVVPDTRTEVVGTLVSRGPRPYVWGLMWLSVLAFVTVAVVLVRRSRGSEPQESRPVRKSATRSRRRWTWRWPWSTPKAKPQSVARVARRALWPLPVLVLVVGSLAVLSAVLPDPFDGWRPLVQWVNIALVLSTAGAAVVWWVPFRAVAPLAATAGAIFAYLMPKPHLSGTQLALLVAACLITTFLLVLAVGNALRRLFAPDTRPTPPIWLVLTAGVGAAALVLERVAIAWFNEGRREWLGYTPPIPLRALYEDFLWDLYDSAMWSVLLVAAAAVYRCYVRYWIAPPPVDAVRIALLLFMVGPVWWDLEVAGTEVPAWPISVAVALVVVWLRREVAPGSDATDPARIVRMAIVPGLLAGVVLFAVRLATEPVIAINQQESVVIDLVDLLGWELAKWFLAAAAVGLAWRYLPGKRGITKVFTPVVVYAAAPASAIGVQLLLGLGVDWRTTADVLLFTTVMLTLGLRLDLTNRPPVEERGRRFTLSNIASVATAAVTPALAVLAIWNALHGGDVSFPSIEPGQVARNADR